jgi:biopolymer transport protein ExbD
MGMGSGGGRGEVTSDINVTPMADVMLVLLIIFMVVTPMLQKGVSVELAKTKKSNRHEGSRSRRCRSRCSNA